MKKAIWMFCAFLSFPLFIVAQRNTQTINDQITIPFTPVKDQQKTGTCWSFATTSFLESELLRQGKGQFDLSEMYFVRHAYLEKAQKFLFYHGKANFSEGGQSHDVMNVIRHFGIATQSAYPGDTKTPGILDHRRLEEDLKKLLDQINDNFSTNKAEKWEEKFNRVLDQHFGKTPNEFQLETQEYSPTSFAEYLGIDPDNYIEFTSFNHHPFYSYIDLEIPDNWSHNRYYNVPVEDLLMVIDSALYKGFSVCWDGDTSEKLFSHRAGMAELSPNEAYDQRARQNTFLNRETTDDHLMHLIGLSLDQSGETFYKIKNSWGTTESKYEGLMYISRPYMQLKTIAIMVHKDAIPTSVKNKLK